MRQQHFTISAKAFGSTTSRATVIPNAPSSSERASGRGRRIAVHGQAWSKPPPQPSPASGGGNGGGEGREGGGGKEVRREESTGGRRRRQRGQDPPQRA